MTLTRVNTAALALVAATALATGCKGDKAPEVDSQTKADLEKCLKDKAEKDKLIKAVEDENARLMRGSATGGEIVIAIEGNALTVKAGKPGQVAPLDEKAAAAASKEFIDVVAKSRGTIQKCYEQALKSNNAPQAKTVTLTVSASFSQAGAYKTAAFSPSLGDTFDKCMRTLAEKWQLPENSPAMTFRAQVSLTPS